MAEIYEADLVFAGGGNYLPSADIWLVIDVLRATTVMTRWFELGGTELYRRNHEDHDFNHGRSKRNSA